MDQVLILNQLLQTVSSEQNDIIRQAAEDKLKNHIDFCPATHQSIAAFLLSSADLSSKKLLLVYTKKMLSKERNWVLSKEIQENLKQICLTYLEFAFACPANYFKLKEAASDIIIAILSLTLQIDELLLAEEKIWARVEGMKLDDLLTGVFLLRRLYKEFQSGLFGSSAEMAKKIARVLTLGNKLVAEFLSALENNQLTCKREEPFMLVACYFSLLRLLRKGFVFLESEKNKEELLAQFEGILKAKFQTLSERTTEFAEEIDFFAQEENKNAVRLLVKIKTRTLKCLSSLKEFKSPSLRKTLQNNLLFANSQLARFAEIKGISAERSGILAPYIYRLLEFESLQIKRLEFYEHFQAHLNIYTNLLLKILAKCLPSDFEAEDNPDEFLNRVDEILIGDGCNEVADGVVRFFIALCDCFEFYPLAAFKICVQKFDEFLDANLNLAELKAADFYAVCKAGLLLTASLHRAINLKRPLINEMALFLLAKIESVKPRTILLVYYLLIFRYFACDIVTDSSDGQQARQIFFGVFQFMLDSLQQPKEKVLELAAIKTLEHLLSGEVISDYPEVRQIYEENANNLFSRLCEVYLISSNKNRGFLIELFVQNFGQKLDFSSILNLLISLCNRDLSFAANDADLLIDLIALLNRVLTIRAFSKEEIELIDQALFPFYSFFFSCKLRKTLEDNFSKLLYDFTLKSNFCGQKRIILLGKIFAEIEEDLYLMNAYFKVINAFFVFGQNCFDLAILNSTLSFLLKKIDKESNIYLLNSFIQNFGEKITPVIFESIFSQIAYLVPELSNCGNNENKTGVVFLFINSIIFIPVESQDQKFVGIFFTVINNFILGQNLFLKVTERKLICCFLAKLIRLSVYKNYFIPQLNKIIIAIFEHIAFIDSARFSEKQTAKKSIKMLAKKASRPLNDSSSEDSEEEDDQFSSEKFTAKFHTEGFAEQFIYSKNLPEELKEIKLICRELREKSPGVYEKTVGSLPFQVAEWLKGVFNMELVAVDREAGIYENRKIVRLKRKCEQSN